MATDLKILTDRIHELEAQKGVAVKALNDVLDYFRYAHEHECTGWACAHCYPQTMATRIENALGIVEDKAVE